MKYSRSRHGPLTISKEAPRKSQGRSGSEETLHPSSVNHWLPCRWRHSRGASKSREMLADWFPCFSSSSTWQSLAPFSFPIENGYRNEKNHRTQQWINNSCQLAAWAIIFIMLPMLCSSPAKENSSLSCLFSNYMWRQQIVRHVDPIRHSKKTSESAGREWKEIDI